MAPSGAEEYRGLAVLLYLAVSPGVRAEARRLPAVRSEAYFEGRSEHQRQPKLPKKSPGSKQDGQKGAVRVGRTVQKAPGHLK